MIVLCDLSKKRFRVMCLGLDAFAVAKATVAGAFHLGGLPFGCSA